MVRLILLGDKMRLEIEELQLIQARQALAEFIRIFVKEYPLVFKDGSGGVNVNPSEQPLFRTRFP